jgi:hypothetical protein
MEISDRLDREMATPAWSRHITDEGDSNQSVRSKVGSVCRSLRPIYHDHIAVKALLTDKCSAVCGP